jgi:hypothetical protein
MASFDACAFRIRTCTATVADVENALESGAVAVLTNLARKGAQVFYHNPFVAHSTEHDLALRSVDCDAPHRRNNLTWLTTNSSLVFDARNAIGRCGCDRVTTL